MNANPEWSINRDFPGGNVLVDRVEGDHAFIRQDLRDTEGDWFYWHFRVRGAAGRTLTFHFAQGHPIGVRGPAVSADDGRTWRWCGAKCARDGIFTWRFAPGEDSVRFSFGIPYLETDLREFLSRHGGDPRLVVETLCVTPKGRAVERLRVGCLGCPPRHRVLVTARHHCCEAMANYAMEGIIETVLGDRDEGRWLAGNVEFAVVPFVDKDGVEDGDQGKNRRPHDHNRDYAGVSLYASTRALREFAPRWSEGRLSVALDLHCPWIRGFWNEQVYIVGSSDAVMWREQVRFAEALASIPPRALPFSLHNALPFGQDWNVAANYGGFTNFVRWARQALGVRLATSIEIAYANAEGVEVTPLRARAFGHDLARALCRYLRA